MSTIEDAYQFALKVEEKLNRRFERKQSGRGRGGKTSGWSYGGRNEDQKKNDDSSSSHKGGEIIPIVLVIKIMEIKEEEDEDREEEAFVEHVSNVGEKDIEPMRVPNTKGGQIGDLRVMHELHM